jgi:hypothetical protein
MTVPVERTNAVINTEQFLLDLLDAKKTPRIPKAIRERAHGLLRHYPSKYHMDMIADKEDGSTSAFYSKVFGKDYK